MKKIAVFTLSLMLFASCLPKEVAESNGTSSSKWNLSSNSFPLNLKVSTDFDANESGAITDMANNWENEANSGIQFFNTGSSTAPKSNNLNDYQDSNMGVYRINSWPSDLPNDALAVTQIFGLRTNIGQSNEYIEITHADILMNYDNFTFSTDGSSGYDFQTVLIHELGHFLGLFHNNTSRAESVMYRSIGRFTNNRIPKALDIEALKSLYGIGSGASQASASRSIASANEQTSRTEAVVILFELKADGKEKVKILDKNRKLIKTINTGCGH